MQNLFRAGKVKGLNAKKFLALGIVFTFIITPIVVLRAPNNLAPNLPKRTTPIRVACVGDSITQITEYTADL